VKLNLGCGKQPREGWVNLDACDLPGVDVVCQWGREPLPFGDDTVEEARAEHVLEHLAEALPAMQELWRVAAPGALFTVTVPHGGSDGAWENPTHVRPYFPDSFQFFGQPYYWREDYGYQGDWQVRTVTLAVAEQHLAPGGRFAKAPLEFVVQELRERRNLVLELRAVLEAVKPPRLPLLGLQEGYETRIAPARIA